MVSFRLSEQEYDTLKKSSISNGARSVSDFARLVACQDSAKLEDALHSLSKAMEKLDGSIQKLIELSEPK
jgi:hypothetical protein